MRLRDLVSLWQDSHVHSLTHYYPTTESEIVPGTNVKGRPAVGRPLKLAGGTVSLRAARLRDWAEGCSIVL